MAFFFLFFLFGFFGFCWLDLEKGEKKVVRDLFVLRMELAG